MIDIFIISPSPDQSYDQGKQISICWIYDAVDASIIIQLCGAQGCLDICSNLRNDGVYNWIPFDLPAGFYCITVSAEGASGRSGQFSLREPRQSSNPIAVVQQILDQTLAPILFPTTRGPSRHVTYGALMEQQKRCQRPKLTRPVKSLPRTSGPTVALSASEVRRCLYQMLNTPDIATDVVLSNGNTVGQFAVRYIIMHAQKRERKRSREY